MNPSPSTLTLSFGSSPSGVALTLSDPQQQRVLMSMAQMQAQATAQEEVLTRVYRLSPNKTPGLHYDDRLASRLNCGKTKAYELLQAGVLRHQRIGNKYIISERAVREYFGDVALEAA